MKTLSDVLLDPGVQSRLVERSSSSRMGSLKTSSRSSVLLSVGDFFWSGCVIAPLVVTYWRGTWELLEDWVSILTFIFKLAFHCARCAPSNLGTSLDNILIGQQKSSKVSFSAHKFCGISSFNIFFLHWCFFAQKCFDHHACKGLIHRTLWLIFSRCIPVQVKTLSLRTMTPVHGWDGTISWLESPATVSDCSRESFLTWFSITWRRSWMEGLGGCRSQCPGSTSLSTPSPGSVSGEESGLSWHET